jgi:hypothetical protein
MLEAILKRVKLTWLLALMSGESTATSCIVNTKLAVFSGTPDHERAGDMPPLAPSQV